MRVYDCAGEDITRPDRKQLKWSKDLMSHTVSVKGVPGKPELLQLMIRLAHLPGWQVPRSRLKPTQRTQYHVHTIQYTLSYSCSSIHHHHHHTAFFVYLGGSEACLRERKTL